MSTTEMTVYPRTYQSSRPGEYSRESMSYWQIVKECLFRTLCCGRRVKINWWKFSGAIFVICWTIGALAAVSICCMGIYDLNQTKEYRKDICDPHFDVSIIGESTACAWGSIFTWTMVWNETVKEWQHNHRIELRFPPVDQEWMRYVDCNRKARVQEWMDDLQDKIDHPPNSIIRCYRKNEGRGIIFDKNREESWVLGVVLSVTIGIPFSILFLVLSCIWDRI